MIADPSPGGHDCVVDIGGNLMAIGVGDACQHDDPRAHGRLRACFAAGWFRNAPGNAGSILFAIGLFVLDLT